MFDIPLRTGSSEPSSNRTGRAAEIRLETSPMGKIQMLLLCWAFGAVAGWFFYQALSTQSVWVKRNTFQSPWYYKIHRSERPFSYWVNTVAIGLSTIAAFLAPLYIAGQ
jgi:hypothetical protein